MDQNNGARKSKSVRRSEGVQRSLIERLDSTAENNPLLWLPCVSLLAAICGTKRLVSDIGAVLVRPEEPEPIEDCKAVISDRPVLIKALSAFLAASIMITFTPGLNGVVFTEAFAEESVSGSDADGQENGSTGSGEQENDGGEASQNSSSKSASAKSKSKKDIKITLNCLLKGMSGGNAHAVISKEHLENSADVWLVSSDASRKDAESVMMQLGENASYYLCYPFEISIYDADSKEPVKLPENGSVEIEMPIPKIMSSCTDKMKVYHVDDSYPTFVESEIITSEDETQSVKFTATELATYIFVAPAAAKDTSADVSQNTVPVVSKDDIPSASDEDSNTAPIANEDTPSASAEEDKNAPAANENTPSASAEENNNAPAAKEDTPAASAEENNNTPAANEDTPTASAEENNNTPASKEDTPSAYAEENNNAPSANEYIPSAGEDISSAAGAYDASAPAMTAAMPVTGGAVVPVGEAPEKFRLSNRKRRYRIISKRRLDDMVFVF